MSDQQEMEIGDEEKENEEEVDSDLEEDDDDEEEDGESSDDEPAQEKTFIPGTKTEDCDGELEVDENAYILYHQVTFSRMFLKSIIEVILCLSTGQPGTSLSLL